MKNRAARPAGRSRIYGPVPSRRLGLSLGVDILPHKTCSLNCVYCQLGPSPRTRTRRAAYVPAEQVVSQVREALRKAGRVDSITFSGSGEPTLHSELGRMIRGIKKITDTPVTVLTNGTLLRNRAVRRALLAADRVVPSLDAASERVFRAVNRPHPSLRLSAMLRGLAEFRREYRGQLWLEIMLVKGVNDSPAHIAALKKAVSFIKPDRTQLNTVVRPPAERWARPLSPREMRAVRRRLGPSCEISASFGGRTPARSMAAAQERVLATVRRRPATTDDLERSLGIGRKSLEVILARLLGTARILKRKHGGALFFEAASAPERKPGRTRRTRRNHPRARGG